MLNQKCKVMYKKSLTNLRHKKILLIFATSQYAAQLQLGSV